MKSTVVSFLPYELDEYKPGLIPHYFHIPAAPPGDFIVVHIDDCYNDVYLDAERGSLRRVIPGEQVAGAIARDHINASIAVEDGKFPGIKGIPGTFTKEQLLESFEEELAGLQQAQKLWFQNLVRLADDTWNDPMARGKSRAISDTQRDACRSLGLNRPWLDDARIDNIPCPACTTFIPGSAIVCPNCKTVLNAEAYNELNKVVTKDKVASKDEE